MASVDGGVVWSNESYSMRDIVETGVRSFPLLCRTTAGYSGCDEHTLQIGSGETFWVFGVHRQQRLVVQTESSKDVYLSIPTEYQTKVQFVKDGNKKDDNPVPIRKVIDAMEAQSSVRLIFENNRKVSFQVGADMGSSAVFNVLTALNVYDEKYLLAYCVCGRKIFSGVQAIPVYLPIEFSIGEGLVDRDAQLWSKWMDDVAQLTNAFERSAFKTTQEIILFNELPSNGQYEYIKLSDLSNFKEIDKIISSELKQDRENIYEQIQSGKRQITSRRDSSGPNKDHSVSLPRFPPPIPRDSDGRSVPSAVSTRTTIDPPSPRSPPPPPIPSRSSEEAASLRPSVASRSQRTPYEPLQLPADRSSSSSFEAYECLSDVPVDIDFGRLTVEQVVDCLRLLKMTQHCDEFRSRQIDGRMAMSLTEAMLVEDFCFRSFDATQFMSFAKKKWRPKRSTTREQRQQSKEETKEEEEEEEDREENV